MPLQPIKSKDLPKFSTYYWDEDKKILCRTIPSQMSLDSKHILWTGEFRGTAAFNKEIYNKYKDKADLIGFHYKDKKYYASIETFEEHKKEINYVEPQYALSDFWWTSEPMKQKQIKLFGYDD